MGQFKPMPKMKTTEPSVELKLKKGGSVKKAMGGVLPVRDSERGVPAAARRGVAPAMPSRGTGMGGMPTRPAPGPVMRKEGGAAKMHARNERAEIKRVEKELKYHEGKPAGKAHKGLKTGGVVERYKTGGVADANGGGYKRGGKAKC